VRSGCGRMQHSGQTGLMPTTMQKAAAAAGRLQHPQGSASSSHSSHSSSSGSECAWPGSLAVCLAAGGVVTAAMKT
jgi:hypothetical protein